MHTPLFPTTGIQASWHRMVALAALLLVGNSSLTPAQTTPTGVALPEGITKVASVEGITEYQLKSSDTKNRMSGRMNNRSSCFLANPYKTS
ncbi:hypothetical protein GCM10028808_52810 [Spirosoma migulaei]